MEDYQNRVEAILFTTGKFMTVDEIASFCGIGSKGIVKDLLAKIKEKYNKEENSLELFESEGKWKLGIKKKYNYLTTKLLSESELDMPTQATLAVIAYRNPALQSDIVKIRGCGAYDHIKALKELEFLVSERYGRTRLLKLTPKFFDYFDVVENELTSKFEGAIDEIEKSIKDKEEELDAPRVVNKEEPQNSNNTE